MKQLRDCQTAKLYDKKRDQMITVPVRTGTMGGLLLILPRDVPCPSDGRMNIIFCSPSMGLITCDCILFAPYIEEDHQHCSYRCQVLKQLSCEQRREDLKIPVSISVTVTWEEDTRKQEAPATLRDISAGGVYLITSLRAKEGDHFSFVFESAGSAMPLTAEILRSELQAVRGQPMYGYGCRFVNMPERYEAGLRNYVFREERRRHG